jgi:hypothetical protein
MSAGSIYAKFQSNLMKRAFRVEGEGSCVRLSVAEDVLKETIKECMEYVEPPMYDFWGQEVRVRGLVK